MITDFDAYLIAAGSHRRAYDSLGAHLAVESGIAGVRFAVWAPNADAVTVIGDFNGWGHGITELRPVGDSGIWQGFVPNLSAGSRYKYGIRPRGTESWLEKADPFARAAELRPNTASIVAELAGYAWGDGEWIARRENSDWLGSPISVYEVHLSSWRKDPRDRDRFLTYRELADQLPQYVSSMGFTHVELLPIAEHPLDMSWGYQTAGYFAPTSRFGTPTEFMELVNSFHRAGIGVILDWVPAHFPKDAHGLARFDGSHLYEHADPRQGEHPDWGTLIFNFGRNEVRTFLISNAVFWLDEYHIDGLRVDAVASMLYLDYSRGPGEWIPNRFGGRENLEAIDFLRELNSAVHGEFPGVLTVAEESTAWPGVTGSLDSGGLGFDFKWNMGWMHDTLVYMGHDPVHRRFHQNELTFSLTYAFSEKFVLPLSHDEVVHGKGSLLARMPGDNRQKFATLRLLFGFMFGHPGKKLLFMGDEFGQWREWNHAESLDWHLAAEEYEEHELHRGVQKLVRDLNHLYQRREAMHRLDHDPAGFAWIDYFDADNSVIAFQRSSGTASSLLVFVCNFTPVARRHYRVGLPSAGRYREILNTDATEYGGSGSRNELPIEAEDLPWHGRRYSAELTLPSLGISILESENEY